MLQTLVVIEKHLPILRSSEQTYQIQTVDPYHLSIIIIINYCNLVLWHCHQVAPCKISYKLKSASHVSLTNFLHPFLQRALSPKQPRAPARECRHGYSSAVIPWTTNGWVSMSFPRALFIYGRMQCLIRVPTNLESQGESGKVRVAEFGWSGKVREKSGNFGWSQEKRRKEEKTLNK